MPNKDDLIPEWVSMFGPLPEEWRAHIPPPEIGFPELEEVTLTDWLHDTYFDDNKTTCFAEEHIEVAGELLQSIMEYRPLDRPQISGLLVHPWFRENPFASPGSEKTNLQQVL